MADQASVGSNESASTSDEYEIIPSNTLNVKLLSYILYNVSIVISIIYLEM